METSRDTTQEVYSILFLSEEMEDIVSKDLLYVYQMLYDFPLHIDRAFREFYHEGLEEAIEAFASRWGGLDWETFQHVLEVGQGVDKLIALFALGYLATPETQALLASFLH